MFRVAVLLILASVLFAAFALISCLSVEDKREIRGAPRALWVLAIVLVPVAGAAGWFLLGRPRPAGPAGAGRLRPGGVLPGPARRRAPDDDPEFLRSLDQPAALNDDDERLLRQWEEEQRRRRDPGTEG